MVKQRRHSTLRRFLVLPGPERRLLFEAWCRLAGAAMRLRFAPRRTVAEALAEAASPMRRRAAAASSSQLALAVSRAAAHHLLPMTCLPRSLALQRMLRSRGVAAELRIGVRKEPVAGGGIAAHAWIEVDGVPLGEPQAIEARFQTLVPVVAQPQR